MLAVIQKKFCLNFIPAGNPCIKRGSGQHLPADKRVCTGLGDSDLPRLFHDFDPAHILNPAPLIRKQKSIFIRNDF